MQTASLSDSRSRSVPRGRLWIVAGFFAFLSSYGALTYSFASVGIWPLIKDAGVAVFAVTGIVYTLLSTRNRYSVRWYMFVASLIGLVVWALWGAAVGLLIGHQPANVLAGFRFYTVYPMMALYAAVAAYSVEARKAYVKVFMYTGVICVAVGVAIFIFSDVQLAQQLAQIRSGITDRGLVGLLGNRPSMGIYAAMVFALAVGYRRHMRPVMFWIVTSTAVLATLLTYSRTGYVALLFVVLVTVLVERSWKLGGIVVLSVFVIVGVLSYFMGDVIASIERAVTKVDVSMSGRVSMWDQLVDNANLYGNGLGFFGVNTSDVNLGPASMGGAVDNTFLKVMLELGLGSLCLFSLLLIPAWYEAQSCIRAKHASPELLVFALMFSSGLTLDWLHIAPVTFVLWWAVGSVAARWIRITRNRCAVATPSLRLTPIT